MGKTQDEMFDPHEPCRKQLLKLNTDWADRYYNSSRVKSVVMETIGGDGDKVMNILQVLEVINEDDGVTVIVR